MYRTSRALRALGLPGSRRPPLLCLLAGYLGAASLALAGTTWDGGGGNNNWSTGANWNGDTTPPVGTTVDLTFQGTTRLSPNNDYTAWDDFRSIYFNSGAGAFTISGNQIDFYDGKFENNDDSLQTISFSSFSLNSGSQEANPVSGDLTLDGGGSIFNNGNGLEVYGDNGHVLTILKDLTGGGGLFVRQYSVVAINTNTTYTGNTEIDEGEIWIGPNGSIAAGSAIYVGNGASTGNDCKFFLNDADGGLTFSRTLNINNGDGTEQNRELGGLNTSGTNTFSGSISRAAGGNKTITLYVATGGTVEFSGVISGDHTVMKRGAGTARFSNANTYSANTEINAGALHIAQGGSIAGGTVYVGSGASTGTAATFLIVDGDGSTTVARTVQINPGSGGNRTIGGSNTSNVNTFSGTIDRDADGDDESVTLTAAAGGIVEYTGAFDGNDAVYVTGGGVTRFGSTGKTYTGETVITNSSTLRIAAANLVDDGSSFTVEAGSTFDLGGNNETIGFLQGGGSVTLGAGQLIVDFTSARTFAGVISGTGSVVKKGTGVWTLSGTNSWSGGIFPVGGTMQFNTNQHANFSGEIRLGETSGSDAATLSIGLGGVTITNAVTVRTGSSGTKTIAGDNTSGTATFSGPVTLSNNVAITAASGGTLVFTNAMSGGSTSYFTATVSGGGTVNLVGGANNTNLAIVATGGTLQLGKSGTGATLHAVDSGLVVTGAVVQLTGSGGDQIFNNSALTVAAGRFDLNGRGETVDAFGGTGGVVTNSSGTAATLTVGSNGGSGAFSGNIVSGAGSIQLTKNGAGTLTLSGNNTYPGQTLVNAGTLNINSATAIGAGIFNISANITFDNTSGAAITLTSNNAVTLGGSPTFTGSNNLNLGSGGVTFSGASRTITVSAGTLMTSGAFTDSGNVRKITKAGAGTLVMAGAAGTWTGGMQLDAGTLAVSNDTALGTGTLVLNGGTVQSAGGARSIDNVTVLTNSTTVAGADAFTFNGSTFTQSRGSRTLTLNNSAATTINGTLYLSDESGTGRTLTLAGTGNVTLNGAVADFNGAGAPGGVTITDTGTVTYNGTNTYSGLTIVSAGVLQVNVNPAAGFSSAGIRLGDTTGSAAATLAIGVGGVTVTNAITVRSGSSGTKTIAANNVSGTATFSGPVALSNNVTLTANSGGALVLSGAVAMTSAADNDITVTGANDTTLSGAISATASASDITKSGAGVLTLSGNNSGANFKLTVSAGTLYLNSANALGAAYTNKINFGGNATLRVGATQGPAGLGLQINGNHTATVEVDSGVVFTVAGAIDDLANTGNLTKTGTGTLVLQGTNRIDGTTRVSAGTLQVDGGASLGPTITVEDTATLKGRGAVSTLTIKSGSILAPGGSVGTLTAGATSWETNGVYVWEINDFAGTYGSDPGWDKLNATNALTINATAAIPFIINLTSLNGTNAGAAANFTNTMAYTKSIATATSIVGFAANKFTLNTNDFQHDLNGGIWSIQQSSTNLDLVFSPAGAGPMISAGPGTLTFSTMLGSAPATQTFGVTNIAFGSMTYTNTVTYGSGASGWASIAPAPAVLTAGASQSHTVTVSVVGAAGTFHATNTITGSFTNSDAQIVFALTVTNIPPPSAPSATADGKELVRLAWTKAPGLDTLILASTNAITTDPSPGTNYATGASVGGATVIYKGSAQALEHVVPPGRTNFYRFYAVNNDYYSPDTVGASAVTGLYRAGEIVDAFAYTNGTALAGLAGGQGWTAGWVTGAQGTKLVETNYSASGVPYFPGLANYPAVAANRLHFSNPGNGSTNRAERSFSVVSTGQIYAAAMVAYQFQGANKWAGISLMSNTTEKVFAGKIGSGANRTLGLDGVGGQVASSPTYELWPYGSPGDTGRVYVVVLRYDFATRQLVTRAYDMLGQTVPTAEPTTWDATDTLAAGDIVTLDGVRVHAGSADLANSVGQSYFDEVRVATNWYELLNVTGPVLDVNPAALTFTAGLGQNPATASQTFTVSNLNAGTMAYTSLVSYGASAADWLAVAPATGLVGASSGNLSTATVATTYHLSRGTYHATNTVYAGEGGTQSVVVTLSVTGYNGRVIYEPFNTAAGLLNTSSGGFGWNSSWAINAGSPEPFFNGAGGLPDFGVYCADGGHVRINSWEGGYPSFREAYREFSPFTNGVVYFAVKINIGNTGLNREAGLRLMNGGTAKIEVGKVVASDGTGYLSALYLSGQNNVATSWQLFGSTDYLIVGRYDFGGRVLRVKGYSTGFVPGVNEPGASSWDINVTGTAEIDAINRASIYTRNGSTTPEDPGIVLFDDLRLATTWNDLMCDLGGPQTLPVVSNVTFHAVSSTNSVTDGQLNSGNFPLAVEFYDRYGIRSDSTTAPFFRPNFDLVNSSGDAFVADRFFGTTNYSADGTVMVGSNATIAPVTSVNIPIGTAALQWSAISSNAGYRINHPSTSTGSNITFSVYDDDVTGPTPTLIFIGANYTIGASQTNITDADLANSGNYADIAVRWDDPSGVFLTNSPPFGNVNIGSESGRVIANWDLFTTNTVTHTTVDFGFNQVFTNFIGVNGATSVTTWQQNAFVITNIDFNNVFYLTASAEDEDNDRGTYADPGSNGDDVPWDRTVITNAPSFLSVVDDDLAAPALTSLRLSGNSRGTNVVTGTELSSGGWSITGIVQDAYSGIRVNGTSTNVPANSPFLRILDPSGAVRLTQILTNGIVNGDTNARPVAVTNVSISGSIQGGVWTALVVVTDIDADRVDDALTTTNIIYFAVPTFEWDAGGAGDRNWSNATNWTADLEPGAFDTAFVNGGYTALVTLAGEVVTNLFVGDNGFDGGSDNGTGTVEQTGGSLGVRSGLTLGENPGDRGTYDISGGSLTVTGLTTVGSAGIGLMTVTGTAAVTAIGNWIVGAGSAGAEDSGSALTVAGGTALASADLIAGNNAGANGAIVQNGGVLTVMDSAFIGNAAGATGTLTVTGGQLNAGGAGATEHLFVGVAGLGAMTVSGSATVTVSSAKDLVIGDTAGNGANNTVTLNGGVLTVGDAIELGDASAARGILAVSGGDGSATNVNVGNANGSTGTVTVTSGRLNAVSDLVVGRLGVGAVTISGGAVTAGVITVSDFAGGAGSTLTVSGGRLDTTGTGDLNVDYAATVSVSAGTVSVDMVNFATNGIATLNLSGGLLAVGNDFNLGAGSGATGLVNQSGGTLQLGAGQPLVLGGQGATGNRNGWYTITNGTITIAAGSDDGDLELGDADVATGRGVFHVLGAAPVVTVGDDLEMSAQNNGELQVTLWNGAIAAISVGDDATLNGTLTVSNIGAVAEGRYMIITNALSGANIAGAFAVTNWAGSVTGRVVKSAHQVDLVFGPVMNVLGTNGAVIADGNVTSSVDDGTLLTNIVAATSVSRTFTITNANATYMLNLTSNPAVSLSGATNFTVTSQPATTNLNGLTATTFTLQFAPDVVGIYTTTVTIANNDPLQNPYDFRVVGHAVLAAEPTLASSNLIFTAVSNAQMTVSWSNGDGANRILVAKAGGSVTNTPADGTGYTANSVHSNGSTIATGVYVVYNGSGTNVTVTGLFPGTTYSFALFEYNGNAGGANYLTSLFATGTQATVTFAPVITQGTNANVTMSENGSPVPFSLTLNATDADTPYGDVIRWSVLAAPFYGGATASATGGTVTVTYAPARYFSGPDYFIVMASDNFNNFDLITVNVTVTPVNLPGNVFYLFE